MALPKIKEVTSILSFCKKLFSNGSFRHVQNYITGLISIGKKSIRKISKKANVNQQTLNYTLNDAKFDKEKLEERYFKKIKYFFKSLSYSRRYSRGEKWKENRINPKTF